MARLSDFGGRITVPDANGQTPLPVAVEAWQAPVAQLLLDQGPTPTGQTAGASSHADWQTRVRCTVN